MIQEKRLRGAYKAIHDLLLIGRQMAFEKMDYASMARFFDQAELLPALLLEERDRTQYFEEYLESIASEFPAALYALEHYRNNNCPER